VYREGQGLPEGAAFGLSRVEAEVLFRDRLQWDLGGFEFGHDEK
jgi:hypothetical protein